MRVKVALATTLLVCLALAATAAAWRSPTSREQVAISKVARGSPHAGTGQVHVSHIRVSTKGPWASATVTLFFSGEPDSATDVLHKVGGRWRLTKHSPGTDGEWCGIGMPRADRIDLGFPAACPRSV